MRRRLSAFTLIEIMIVIMIIGLLIGIAVPQWHRSRDNTRVRTCLTNLKEIDNAKARWAMEMRRGGSDTPTESDLVPEFIKTSFPQCPSGGTYTIGIVDNPATCSIHGTSTSITP